MTFLTGKTCRKSAPFRVGYLRAGGLIPAVTAGLSLSLASFTPSAIPFACAQDTTCVGPVGLTTFRSIDTAMPLEAPSPPAALRTTSR